MSRLWDAPVRDGIPPQIARIQHFLVVPKSQLCLPARCVFCNAPTQGTPMYVDLSSTHPDHREPPLPLGSVKIIHSINANIFHQQRSTIGIHLCPQHRAHIARGVLLQRFLVLLLAGLFAGLAFVASPWLFVLSGLSLGALPLCRPSNPISLYLVTEEEIWLENCGKAFLLSFPGSGDVERPEAAEWPW